jgi:hypothetical protein
MLRNLLNARVPMAPFAALLLLLSSTVVVLGANERLRPVAESAVYDSRGRLVGIVQDIQGTSGIPGSVWVLLRAGTVPVTLNVNRLELSPGGNTAAAELFFESEDCTGQAFFGGVAEDPSFLMPVVVINGQKLYAAFGPHETRVMRSFLTTDGLTCGQQTYETQFSRLGNQIADLAAEYQPPFELRLLRD